MTTRPSMRSTAQPLEIDAELLREAILLAERVDQRVKEWTDRHRNPRSAPDTPDSEEETLPQPT